MDVVVVLSHIHTYLVNKRHLAVGGAKCYSIPPVFSSIVPSGSKGLFLAAQEFRAISFISQAIAEPRIPQEESVLKTLLRLRRWKRQGKERDSAAPGRDGEQGRVLRNLFLKIGSVYGCRGNQIFKRDLQPPGRSLCQVQRGASRGGYQEAF